jgi:hypothetical protein
VIETGRHDGQEQNMSRDPIASGKQDTAKKLDKKIDKRELTSDELDGVNGGVRKGETTPHPATPPGVPIPYPN